MSYLSNEQLLLKGYPEINEGVVYVSEASSDATFPVPEHWPEEVVFQESGKPLVLDLSFSSSNVSTLGRAKKNSVDSQA